MSMVSADLVLEQSSVDLTLTAVSIDLVLPQAVVNLNHTPGTTYVHDQGAPLTTWTIVHNLGKVPSITVFDSISRLIIGYEVAIISENELHLTFSAAISGSAYLN